MIDQFDDVFGEDLFQDDANPTETIRLKDGERRNVSILFADIHGFTKLSENLDHETVQSLIDKLMSLFTNSVEKFGGYVDKYSGDEIMALFGAKVASEVDTSRSIFCALDLLNLLERFNQHILKDPKLSEYKINFEMRIGINTGMVTTGKVGKKREGDFTVYGDTVNLASRMESNAPISRIMVNKRTKRLVDNIIEFEDYGEIDVKGKSKKASVFLVKSVKKQDENLSDSVEHKFIGQKENFKKINDAYNVALDTIGELDLKPILLKVNGEAGLGKSRLLSEFKNQRFKGIDYSRYCLNGTSTNITSSPYYLFTSIIREVMQISPMDGMETIQIKSQNLYDSIVEFQDSTLTDIVINTKPVIEFLLGIKSEDSRLKVKGKELQTNIQIALRIFIEGLSTRANASGIPLMVILDDFQWIDQLSLSALEYILSSYNLNNRRNEIASTVTLFIVLQRDKNILSEEIISFTESLSIHVEPLSDIECREYISLELDKDEWSEEFIDQLISHSNGNPFYISEWLHFIQRRGAEKFKDFYSKIPDNLNALILSRIDALKVTTKNTLQVASVIGHEFYDKVVFDIQEKIDQFESDGNQDLSTLVENNLIFKNLNLEYLYNFKSLITRDVTYKSILRSNREILHLNVGEAIEGIFSNNIQSFYYQLAGHFDKGGSEVKAIEYLEYAARKAQDIFDNDKAIEFYSRLLEKIGDSDIESSINSKLSKCKVLELIGDWEEAKEIMIELLESLDYDTYELQIGDIYSRMGSINFKQGNYELAEEYIQKQLDIAPANNPIGEAIAWGQLGRLFIETGRLDEAKDYFDKQLEFYNNKSMESDVAISHRCLGQLALKKGDLDDAYNESESAYKLSVKLDQLWEQSLALGNMGIVKRNKGEFEEALTIFNKVLEINEDIGDQMAIYQSYVNLGNTFRGMRNFNDALECFEKQISICERIGSEPGLAQGLNSLGTVYNYMGRYNEAIENLNNALTLNTKIGNRTEIGNVNGNLGIAYTEIGDFEMALSHYDKVRNIFSDMGNDFLCSMVDSESAIVYLLMDKPGMAIDKLSPSIEIFNKQGAKSSLAKYSAVEAEAFIDLDRYNEAEKSITTALKFAKEIDDKDLILTSKLLHAVILFHISDDLMSFSSFTDKLLKSSHSNEIKGRIYYEKWKIDKTQNSKDNALKVYTELKGRYNRFIDSKIFNHLSSNPTKV